MKIRKINRKSIGISGFTSVLNTIHTPPAELYVAGALPEGPVKSVAIVGSRKPTAYGVHATHRLAYDLAKRGIVIISGLAFGVDAVAHKAALEAGGTTVAVMANGLHRIYPTAHTQLARDIVALGGAIISEKPTGEDARSYDFLKRNRLVSGLADAVIVTEATEKSGTLSTIGHALDQNKVIFAVPGPITSLLSVGPNKLIQQGAHVALSAQDVTDIIAPELAKTQTQLALGDTPLEDAILSAIRTGINTIDTLTSNLSTESSSAISQTITLMELKGTLICTAGVFAINE